MGGGGEIRNPQSAIRNSPVTVIGGGLAGSEAAWQLARRGIAVRLYEMRPVCSTPAHHTDQLAELVCSNSFRSASLDAAVGLLKEEMRCLGSLVMQVADRTRVPAGSALAVDRDLFAGQLTAAIAALPEVTLVREEVTALPDGLTSELPVAIDYLARDYSSFRQALLDFVPTRFPSWHSSGIRLDPRRCIRAGGPGPGTREEGRGEGSGYAQGKEEG